MSKPVIILVQPQLAENIGMAARAMYNGGLTELRLVRPQDGWPNPRVIKPSAGGHPVLENVQVFETTREAIADLRVVYATTARSRDMAQRIVTPRKAAEELHMACTQGQKVGVLFGPERTGLLNEDLSYANTLIRAPLNPAYTSLNLAQAVLLIAYEWFQIQANPPDEILHKGKMPWATHEEITGFLDHLESELDRSGFLRIPHKRPAMVRNIRNLFLRGPLTSQEIRTLRGIITSLVDPFFPRLDEK